MDFDLENSIPTDLKVLIPHRNSEVESIIRKEYGEEVDGLDMCSIRDFLTLLINSDNNYKVDSDYAEESFLYMYHFREALFISNIGRLILKKGLKNIHHNFIEEFYDQTSSTGLSDLKVLQINNESDKLYFSKINASNELVKEWRKDRFNRFLEFADI